MKKIKIEQHCGVGMVWFGGWLCTIGFLHLTFGKALLAILLWPYFIGTFLDGVL